MTISEPSNFFSIYLIKVDMKIFRHFSDYILENGPETYTSFSHNMKIALKVALLLCYTRPFIENQSLMIHKLLIKDFNDEEIIIHKEIIDMRKKHLGLSNLPVPDIKSIEPKVFHISIPKNDSTPLQYKLVESLKNMADKINDAAIKIVETPEFEHKFCFRGVDLQR